MTLSRRFADALVFAHDVHQQQVRKGSGVPYISHVMGVASLVLDFGGSEDEAIGALLHDAVEDAPPSRPRIKDEIGSAFGPAVLQIVLDCSDTDVHPKPPWRERKKAYISHLPGVGPSAKLVSASDKLHNCRAIHRDFGSIGDAIFARFNKEAGKLGTLGYYRVLADTFAATFPHPVTTELSRAVEGLERDALAGRRAPWPPA
jgi:(p)ppGpp synthase/HD superfamily hydrolase